MENKTVESLRVKLTEKEQIEYSKQLAKHINDLQDKENKKKETVKIIDGEIAVCKAQINILSLKISNGYEYRAVECSWCIREPEGHKTLYRDDTGEIVRIVKLSQDDLQRKLRLDIPEELLGKRLV